MRTAFKNFLVNNPDYKNGKYKGNPYTVIIGVPCDWGSDDINENKKPAEEKNDIDEYQKMALEAGIPNVQVVKESQAAMFYARRFMRRAISDADIRRGVLLVDVGSSTIDFTYMKDADILGHCGLALGAKHIEQVFLREALNREKIRYWADYVAEGIRVLARDPNDAARMQSEDVFRVRKDKEEYFCGVDQNPVYAQPTADTPVSKVSIGECSGNMWYITRDYVDYCLEDGNSPCRFKLTQLSREWDGAGLDSSNTWRGHFRNALEHVKKKWSVNASTTIIVTGGATRMQFVENDIVAVFKPLRKPYFGDDGERSFSVVKGLAWCGFARNHIEKAKQEIVKFFQSADIEEIQPGLRKLKTAIGEYVDSLLEDPASEIASNVKVRLCTMLRAHDDTVNTIAKIEESYSRIMCDEWNNLTSELNKGISVKSILDSPILAGMTSHLYELFVRPEITVSTDVKASFRHEMKKAHMRFNPLSHIFSPPGRNQDFNSCFRDMFVRAADGCEINITSDLVKDHFQRPIELIKTEEIIPSFRQHLCDAILTRVREFKLSEIDKISGALEYDSNRRRS